MKPKFDFDDLYEDLMEHQKVLAEGTDAKAVIKSLVDTSFGGDNESQMKAVQLLKGLATSDDPAANAFMKKLDAFTSKMSAGDSAGEKVEESVKSIIGEVDNAMDDDFKSDSLKRKGKLITITWKKISGITPDEMSKKYKEALSSEMDKIEKISASKSGAGIILDIQMK
jgi:hypothetical protein